MAIGGSIILGVGALLQGFGDCLFDESKAGACVAHAEGMVDKFQAVGDHFLRWAEAILRAAF